MTLVTAIFLGALQGFTEFLPISSDGHLAVASLFLALPAEAKDQLGFDVFLHAGSLLALLVCYAKTWKKLIASLWNGDEEHRRLLLLLVVGTIPAVIAGVFLQDAVANLFRTITLAGIGFLVTAVILILGEYIGKPFGFACLAGRQAQGESRMAVGRIKISHALFIGIAQAIAILPGVSRSGLTISAGRIAGLTRPSALDFSFLLATPVIAGAVAFILVQTVSGTINLPAYPVLAAGFLASFITSVIAIVLLLRFVRRFSLAWFALYLIPLGLFLLTR